MGVVSVGGHGEVKRKRGKKGVKDVWRERGLKRNQGVRGIKAR